MIHLRIEKKSFVFGWLPGHFFLLSWRKRKGGSAVYNEQGKSPARDAMQDRKS
jgi:hypothetical protein